MAALLYFESTTSICGKVKQTGLLLPIAFKDKFDNIAFFGTVILYPDIKIKLITCKIWSNVRELEIEIVKRFIFAIRNHTIKTTQKTKQ